MRMFLPKRNVKSIAYVRSMDDYRKLYDRSIRDSDGFWSEHADCIHWFKKWKKVTDCDFRRAKIAWFVGGRTNACYNCLDRHVEAGRGGKVALIWEGNDPSESKRFTFAELLAEVKRFANVLKKHGLKKGDAVTVYLPMVPELPIAMLACARIGVIHNVVFGGFSAESLKTRIADAQSKMVIVSDGSFRAEKKIPLKASCDEAIKDLDFVKKCIVVERTGMEIDMLEGRDFLWSEEMALAGDECPCEEMDAEDPLFILYTSGSTGRPKGVLHTNGGYMVYASMTHKYVFDYHDKDIFWCTADIGWITGHTYIVYGPLANHATSLMFEGVPSYPDYGRFWDIVDKYKVTQFYTAPTVIRACMKEGDEWVSKHDLSSLRILGTVGEPINPEAWLWYYDVVGRKRCPVVDTWWQTESGGILITPLPGATPLKPSSATFPFFGVVPAVLDDKGKEIKDTAAGNLVLKSSWPGMMRGVFRDPERFRKTYFEDFPGYYLTGDGAHRDEEGYYWITGRVDDVLKVSGHRMGTAELESAFDSHDSVAETAVVGVPHDVKGQAIYAFVILNKGVEPSDDLKKELVQIVRKEIGPIATPDFIQFADGLPKTRSGKIMRRILRKIAAGERDLGDTSTLADPSVVEKLVAGRVMR